MNNDANLLKESLISGFKNLDSKKDEVNSLNVFPVPDGDTGTNMSLTLKSALKKMSDLNEPSIESIAEAMSKGSLMGARGNSGVITSQIFRGFYLGLKEHDNLSVKAIRDAFSNSYKTAYKAVIKPTEGTILTVIRKMGEFAEENFTNYSDYKKFLTDIVSVGNKTLLETQDLLPVLKEAGVVDAGGQGLMLFLEGALNHDKKEMIESSSIDDKNMTINENLDKDEPSQDKNFDYLLEFNTDTDKSPVDYKSSLEKSGDSFTISQGIVGINTKIYTNHPGNIIELALELGPVSNLKLTNLKIDTDSNLKEAIDKNKEFSSKLPPKEYGVVTISSGKGFSSVFESLNVDRVITGGQTMNPSTEDILDAINSINAKTIFVFPNNKNIILAAKQAANLSDKKIYVVETKSVPQAISALLEFDTSLSADENFALFNKLIEDVKTGEVTYAVKDLSLENLKVKKDDIMGLDSSGIRSVGKDVNKVSKDLLRQIISEKDSLITIYYGEGCDQPMANKLMEDLQKEYKKIDIEVVNGGQPLYYYIFSVE